MAGKVRAGPAVRALPQGDPAEGALRPRGGGGRGPGVLPGCRPRQGPLRSTQLSEKNENIIDIIGYQELAEALRNAKGKNQLLPAIGRTLPF